MGELPGPERTAIQVNEVCARVISDAAVFQFERGLSDLANTHAGNEEVDGLPFDVETVPDSPAASPDQ